MIPTGLENTIYDTKETWRTDKHIQLKVFRLTVRQLEIMWTDIPMEYFRDSKSKAYLQVSESPTSGFETLEEITYNHPPFYVDEHTVTTFFRSMLTYYRIVFPDAKVVTGVFSSEDRPNFYGAEIARRHAIMLKEGHNGNLMYLFIRRMSKERCPNCWDTLRGTRSKTECPVCLNTGYLSGYYDPISIYVSLSPESTSVDQPIDGTRIDGNLQGWTAGFPRITMGSMIVDANTRDVWNVAQVNMTTHKRVPTKQDISLQHQEEDTAVMKLLERIPHSSKKEDKRHGEIVF